MRPLQRLTMAAIAALAVTGCAPMTVSSHVAPDLDVARYDTFGWGPADALPTGDARLDKDPFFQDRVQGEVEKALAGRGITLSDTGPSNLLIHYHANISERLDIDRMDLQRGYCPGEGCTPPVVDYEAGTLVIDVIDARTNRLIWRGWAQNSVKDMLNNQDTMARQITEAVTRMFMRFPKSL